VPFFSARLNDRLRTKAETLQMIREEPGKLLQIRMSSLEGDCSRIGLYQYALGFPLDEVRQAFAEAAAAALKVFELRGTSEAFPAVLLTVDPTKPEDDPAFVIEERPLHPPGTRDYSLTNSRDCFQDICLALIGGEYATAEKLAGLMWDPPRASYIGPRSEVCTPNQQHLAYAVKELLHNHPEAAQKELKRIGCRKSEEQVAFLAKMVGGLAERDGASFLEGLQELLRWHRKQVKKPYNQKDPEMYFCVPALGLSVLAVRGGLLQKAELPSDPYLPAELMPA
jgi:immunity protein 49 of polymorphic toxin system